MDIPIDSSQQNAARAVSPTPILTRAQIRRLVEHQICSITLYRLTRQQLLNNPTAPSPRLTAADRDQARRHANMIEGILYKRAICIADYSDLDTLDERVVRCGRALLMDLHRRERERDQVASEERMDHGASEVEAESSRR